MTPRPPLFRKLYPASRLMAPRNGARQMALWHEPHARCAQAAYCAVADVTFARFPDSGESAISVIDDFLLEIT